MFRLDIDLPLNIGFVHPAIRDHDFTSSGDPTRYRFFPTLCIRLAQESLIAFRAPTGVARNGKYNYTSLVTNPCRGSITRGDRTDSEYDHVIKKVFQRMGRSSTWGKYLKFKSSIEHSPAAVQRDD